MKTFCTIVMLFITNCITFSQINLVGSTYGFYPLKLIHFTNIEDKFFKVDTGVIKLYNLDLTEYMRFNYDSLNGNNGQSNGQSYLVNISDKLFNSDSKIEFLFFNKSSTKIETLVVNEDGEIIFKAQDREPYSSTVIGIQGYKSYSENDCIFNTSKGYYLLLFNTAPDGSYSYSESYSLPGNMPNIIKETYSNNSNSETFEVFSEHLKKTVSVRFPDNYSKVKRGLLYIRNLSGKNVKTVNICAQKQDVDVSDLNIGCYIFSYIDGDKVISSRKIVLY